MFFWWTCSAVLGLNMHSALHFFFCSTQLRSPNLLIRSPFWLHPFCFRFCVILFVVHLSNGRSISFEAGRLALCFRKCIFFVSLESYRYLGICQGSRLPGPLFSIFHVSFVVILQLICTSLNCMDGPSPNICSLILTYVKFCSNGWWVLVLNFQYHWLILRYFLYRLLPVG